MSERHVNVFEDINDAVSFMSSTVCDDVFPDVFIITCIRGAPEERVIIGKLDTGAKVCVVAEHVVVTRWGIDKVDSSKRCILTGLETSGVRSLGEINIRIILDDQGRQLETPFQVVPEEYVRHRWDALLSDKLIKKLDILIFNPDWRCRA